MAWGKGRQPIVTTFIDRDSSYPQPFPAPFRASRPERHPEGEITKSYSEMREKVNLPEDPTPAGRCFVITSFSPVHDRTLRQKQQKVNGNSFKKVLPFFEYPVHHFPGEAFFVARVDHGYHFFRRIMKQWLRSPGNACGRREKVQTFFPMNCPVVIK
jgi:hypothetical protein